MTATARSAGLLPCSVCGLVHRAGTGLAVDHQLRCTRCHAPMRSRIPGSLTRTTALLLAAYVLYLPANLMTMMVTESIYGVRNDTIFTGIIYLWIEGSPALAVIVFVASILVPLLKLLALTWLVWMAWRRDTRLTLPRTRLYRLLEFVGRWSMLDIFVVALLTAIVQAQALATVLPGAGAMAFGAVVVLTMLASLSFDPRLIWDPVTVRKDSDERVDTPAGS